MNKKLHKYLGNDWIESRHKKSPMGPITFVTYPHWKKHKLSAYRLKRNLSTWKGVYAFFHEKDLSYRFFYSHYCRFGLPPKVFDDIFSGFYSIFIVNGTQIKNKHVFAGSKGWSVFDVKILKNLSDDVATGYILAKSYPDLFFYYLKDPETTCKIVQMVIPWMTREAADDKIRSLPINSIDFFYYAAKFSNLMRAPVWEVKKHLAKTGGDLSDLHAPAKQPGFKPKRKNAQARTEDGLAKSHITTNSIASTTEIDYKLPDPAGGVNGTET